MCISNTRISNKTQHMQTQHFTWNCATRAWRLATLPVGCGALFCGIFGSTFVSAYFAHSYVKSFVRMCCVYLQSCVCVAQLVFFLLFVFAAQLDLSDILNVNTPAIVCEAMRPLHVQARNAICMTHTRVCNKTRHMQTQHSSYDGASRVCCFANSTLLRGVRGLVLYDVFITLFASAFFAHSYVKLFVGMCRVYFQSCVCVTQCDFFVFRFCGAARSFRNLKSQCACDFLRNDAAFACRAQNGTCVAHTRVCSKTQHTQSEYSTCSCASRVCRFANVPTAWPSWSEDARSKIQWLLQQARLLREVGGRGGTVQTSQPNCIRCAHPLISCKLKLFAHQLFM